MRWLAVLVCLVATASAKPSNPAFLGIGMHDLGGARGAGPCVIETITPDSSASVAGLRPGDVFVSLDGTAVPTCDALVTQIQAREPGTFIKLDIRRSGAPVVIEAELMTRGEVLRRRFVGQIVPSASLLRVDDETLTDLSSRGRTTIVGWFDTRCVGCERVFGSVARWSRARSTRAAPIAVVGATSSGDRGLGRDSVERLTPYARGLDVPLLIADALTFQSFTITDSDRIHFWVIDCRGVVQYVAPVAPDSDDLDAVLDELYAASEQAHRRLKL